MIEVCEVERLLVVFIAPVGFGLKIDLANIDCCCWLDDDGSCRQRGSFKIQANTGAVRMSVWCAACHRGGSGGGDSGFQCGLEPWLGLTVLLAVVGVVAVADVAFMTLSVFTKNIERNVAARLLITDPLTWNVALFTAGLFTADSLILAVTRNVALFTAGLFTAGATVFRAVGRRVSGLGADSAGLIQECGADDFSVGAGLVFDEVVRVVGDWMARIIADLTELAVRRSHPSVGKATKCGGVAGGGGDGSIGISGVRRHLISIVCSWYGNCCRSDLKKNISIFFQMLGKHRIIIYLLF